METPTDAPTEPNTVFRISPFSLRVKRVRRTRLHKEIGPVAMTIDLKFNFEQAQELCDFLSAELKKPSHNLILVSIDGERESG